MATKETLKQQTTRQIDAREKEVTAFALGLERFLDKNLRRLLKDVKGGGTTAKKAALQLGALFSQLEESGLTEVVNQIEGIYAAEVRALKLDFESSTGRALIFTDVDASDLETLVNFQEDRIYSTVQNYVDDTKATLLQSIISGTDFVLDDIIGDVTGRAAANIETELNTAVMSYNRALQFNKAEEYGLDLFIYIGPDDKITRDFCQSVLSGDVDGLEPRDVPIYTTEEIQGMDNLQDLPVSTSGGGWNCRHHWRPITLEFALRLGYADRD